MGGDWPIIPTNNNHAGNVRLGIREQEALLQEFEAIAEKMGEPDADIDQLLEEQVRKCWICEGLSYDRGGGGGAAEAPGHVSSASRLTLQ